MPTSSLMMNRMLGWGFPSDVSCSEVEAAVSATPARDACAWKKFGELKRARIAQRPHLDFIIIPPNGGLPSGLVRNQIQDRFRSSSTTSHTARLHRCAKRHRL